MNILQSTRDNLLKGKMRGQAGFIYLLVMFFVVGIVLAIVIMIWSSLTSNASFESLMTATHTGTVAQASATTSLNILANAAVFLFIFSCVAAIIASTFIQSSPVFAILGIICLPIELLFSFIFHDVFLALINQSVFAGVITAAPNLILAFQYLPLISLVVSLMIIIASVINP